jgi:hypothetical protein
MNNVFRKLGIAFDKNDNTLISRKKLEKVLQLAKLGELYLDESCTFNEGYLLIENNSRDFYPFPLDELEEWELDGSMTLGDKLFKLSYVKTYVTKK